MLLGDYLPDNCSTSGLMGLTQQIVDTLIADLPAGMVIDISSKVNKVGGSTLPYLQKDAAEALIAAIDEKGETPRLVHAVRVIPQQYAVYYWYTHGRKCGVKLAAQPGSSPHERAIAVDFENHGDWINVLARHNWVWRGNDDPPHFNYHGGHDPDFGHKGMKAFQKLWNLHHPDDKIAEDGTYGGETRKRLEASPIEGF